MPGQMPFSEMITNALDKDYSVELAATDLGELMNELEVIKGKYGADSPRLTELAAIIPVQEKLALGKLRDNQVLEQLDRLEIRLEQHD
jgi:hypothetical protein